MKLPQLQTITCWGLTKSVKAFVLKPNNVNELQQSITLAKQNNLQISIKGGGNSYTDVFMNSNQMLIDTSKLNLIKNFDVENGIIVVEAGIKIADLLKITMPKNWSLVALSGSSEDRIGGMISSNTHGKDTWHAGNFSQNILSLKILMADGIIKEVNRDRDLELFNAIIGGLGFFGVIVEVTIKLKHIPSFMVKIKTTRIQNIEDLFEKMYSLDEKETDFSYGLVDPFSKGKSLGRGQMESSKYVDNPNCSNKEFETFLAPKPKVGPLTPETFWKLFRMVWGNNTNNLINKFRYYRPTKSIKSVVPYPKYQYVLSATPKLNLLFYPSGFLEFQSLFPKKDAIEAFSELILMSQKYHHHPFICGIKRHKMDSSFLGFANDGLSITINFSLNQVKKIDKEEYCHKILETILKFDGITYISKHAFLPKEIFQKMYPKYTKILKLKEKYDPENIFSSDATKRLLVE